MISSRQVLLRAPSVWPARRGLWKLLASQSDLAVILRRAFRVAPALVANSFQQLFLACSLLVSRCACCYKPTVSKTTSVVDFMRNPCLDQADPDSSAQGKRGLWTSLEDTSFSCPGESMLTSCGHRGTVYARVERKTRQTGFLRPPPSSAPRRPSLGCRSG